MRMSADAGAAVSKYGRHSNAASRDFRMKDISHQRPARRHSELQQSSAQRDRNKAVTSKIALSLSPPDRAGDLRKPCKLGFLIALGQRIAPDRAGEAALRADRK